MYRSVILRVLALATVLALSASLPAAAAATVATTSTHVPQGEADYQKPGACVGRDDVGCVISVEVNCQPGADCVTICLSMPRPPPPCWEPTSSGIAPPTTTSVAEEDLLCVGWGDGGIKCYVRVYDCGGQYCTWWCWDLDNTEGCPEMPTILPDQESAFPRRHSESSATSMALFSASGASSAG